MNESAIQNIGGKLHAEFDKNAALRRPFEQRWIDDLRQYQGVYPPEVLKKLTEQNRSTLYLRKTKAKVDSIKAHLMDLLFPAKGERNWDISPSTTPEVHPSLLFEARGMMEAHMGRRLNAAELRSLTLSLAADAASGMGDEMENQLAEGPGRKAYRATCESLIFQGVLFGTGVLKGPLVERRKREKFAYSDASGWALGSDEGPLWPYTEFVSIWDVYPDLTSTTVEGLRYVWQTHMKNQQELLELETWPGFNAAAIRAHITEVPDGDAELVQHEADKRQVSNDDGRQVPTSLPGRWRLMERWGYLPGKDLVDAGIEDIDPTEVYPANVWLLGTKVIKAVLAPIEGIDIPYNFFFYSEDETAFFPEGVASIIRHPEKAFNAAMRMVLDNAAICSGPQFGVNMSALHDGTNPDEQYPFKVWKFKSGADLAAAFRVYEINSSIPDLTQVAKLMTGLGYPGEVTDNPKFSDLIPARYRGKFKADTLDALVKLIPIGADGGVTTPGGYVGHTGSSEDWRTGGGGSGGTDGYGGPSGGAGSFGTCFCGGSGGGGGPNYGSGYLGGDAEPFGRQGGNGGIGNLGGSAGAGGGSGRPPGTATTNPGGLGAGGFLALITPYLYGEPGCSIQSMGVKGGAATAYTGPGAGSGGGIVAALMTIDAFKGTITCAGGISGDLNTRSTSAGAGGVGYISRQSGVSDQ